MHFTPDSRANQLTLEAALARLAASPLVEGLALFGSRATEEVAASDYDVLILVKTLPVGIFQMLTHIGGRMADVVFVTIAECDAVLAAEALPSDRTDAGRFLLKMATAEIVYDAAGRLARAQAYARGHPPAVVADEAARHGAWFWLNHALIHMRRLARSTDPIRLTTVDLMLGTNVAEALRIYGRLRGLPWQGEKHALRYLAAHDGDYLARLQSVLAAPERGERVRQFETLVAATLAPLGPAPTWPPGLTAVILDDLAQPTADLAAALAWWEAFFSD